MDNKNVLMNLEEARNILRHVKRIYPALNGVEVFYGDTFAYYPNDLVITIPEEFEDEEQGMRILKHVNEEFGATFEYNLREMSIQALLHECGHHLDFEGKIMTQRLEEYLMADDYNRAIFRNVANEFDDKVRDFMEELEAYNAEEEIDEDFEFKLEQKQMELQIDNEKVDELYRMIPTEYAADQFSARVFMTYIRPYKACNYDL